MMKMLICIVFGMSMSMVLTQTSFPGNTFSNCDPVVSCTNCSGFTLLSGFRTIDGTCNNLVKRSQGAAFTPLARLLPSGYVDNLDTPRGFPGTTPLVKTAHEVASAVFRSRMQNKQRNRGLSVMFMALGQFIDHDVGLTLHPSCDVSQRCRSISAFIYPCFPIQLKQNGTRCTSFARSRPVCQPEEEPRTKREQINVLSSYLDLSQVYSNDIKLLQRLRRQDGTGELVMTETDDLLPLDRPFLDTSCNNPGGCSLVGDERGDENIALHTMHTIWNRHHNFIARKLKEQNPHWSEFLVFENSRKINIAVYQRIVYEEFLPELVDLKSYTGYDINVDASTNNVFSTAAFRFGHSLVPNSWAMLDKDYNEAFEDISLQASFFNTQSIRQFGIEPTAFGLLANQSQVVDTRFAFGLLRRLFVPVGEIRREDLTALNIQRGRDHGLQTYGAWRAFCNLTPLSTFGDLNDTMPQVAIDDFKTIYESPNDIDIFAAGIAETHINGKMLGPTFQCIQKLQFERLRDGDRFWYERPGVFNFAQRSQINQISMSRVLCDTLVGIVSIQRNALEAVTSSTVRPSCANIYSIDFSVWKENTV